MRGTGPAGFAGCEPADGDRPAAETDAVLVGPEVDHAVARRRQSDQPARLGRAGRRHAGFRAPMVRAMPVQQATARPGSRSEIAAQPTTSTAPVESVVEAAEDPEDPFHRGGDRTRIASALRANQPPDEVEHVRRPAAQTSDQIEDGRPRRRTRRAGSSARARRPCIRHRSPDRRRAIGDGAGFTPFFSR